MKLSIKILTPFLGCLILLCACHCANGQAALRQEPATEQQESESKETQGDDDSAAPGTVPEMPVEKNTKKVRRGPSSYSKTSKSFLRAFASTVGSTSSAVVEIKDGRKRIAMGTVIDAAEGLILTKASELRGDLKCKFLDGSTAEPNVVGVDPATDLVLLKVDKQGLNQADFADGQTPPVGSWLATVSQDEVPLAIGIVSHKSRLIRSHLPNSAIIGIRPADRIDGDGVRINFVNSDSPAEKAGLLVNDVITAIDGAEIKDSAQLLEKLSQYHPGDEIVLLILRDEKESEFPVTLGKRRINRMFQDRGTKQNSMGSTLSKRRSDFPLALQHDTALNANDCGGPVVDITGRIIGVNIARGGRVSSLALPNEVVIPVIAKLRSGKMLPEIVNKKEIVSVEKELAQIEQDLKDLPETKIEKELEFSAGSAVEGELQRQIEEAEKRLEELQARLKKKKQANLNLGKSLATLKSRQKRLQREIKPLQQQLKRLKTGVE